MCHHRLRSIHGLYTPRHSPALITSAGRQTRGMLMELLGLHFTTELAESGQVILQCVHDPFLVLLAYLVACASCFATLDMAERINHAQKPASQRLRRRSSARGVGSAPDAWPAESGPCTSLACWRSRRRSTFIIICPSHSC